MTKCASIHGVLAHYDILIKQSPLAVCCHRCRGFHHYTRTFTWMAGAAMTLPRTRAGAAATACRYAFHSILCALNAARQCTCAGDVISYCWCEYLPNGAHSLYLKGKPDCKLTCMYKLIKKVYYRFNNFSFHPEQHQFDFCALLCHSFIVHDSPLLG